MRWFLPRQHQQQCQNSGLHRFVRRAAWQEGRTNTFVGQRRAASWVSSTSSNRSSNRSSNTNTHTPTWGFPRPVAPPSKEDVASLGLPILRQVVQHAQADRPFLTEWPSPDETTTYDRRVSYAEVVRKAIQVSQYLQQKQQHPSASASASSTSTSTSTSPFIAHSTLPGSAYIACQWGCFAAGKASVPLAISHKVPELEHVLEDSNPSLILVSDAAPNHADVLQAASNLHMSDRIVAVDHEVLTRPSPDQGDHLVLLEDPSQLLESSFSSSSSSIQNGPSLDTPALLMYTSGTTGKPKGVVHTHRTLYHQITDLVAAWEWQPEDVASHVLPLHHVHGVVNILSCAAHVGAQVHFQPFHAETLWEEWAQHPPPPHHLSPTERRQKQKEKAQRLLPRPTVFMAVPTIYAKLLQAARHMDPTLIQRAVQHTWHPMRLAVSGSAALPTKILQDWQHLTSQTLLERYGMTEFAMALSNPYNEIVAPRQPGHVGLALPSVQVRLVDEKTGAVLVTAAADGTTSTTPLSDTPGALQVKGPTVFTEYWNRPDATNEAFVEDGWFQTGDVAEYNATLESFRILGRASVDILKVGGHKLSALEVERTLLDHPHVEEVVVVGVSDDVWGQRVAMVGVATTDDPSTIDNVDDDNADDDCKTDHNGNSSPPTLAEVQDWCADRMDSYKIPTQVLWLDEIPKNAMGKVNKTELVQQYFVVVDAPPRV